jgi:uncharacterized membrane protein (UPF0127 family)
MKKIVAVMVILSIPVIYFLYTYRNDMPFFPQVAQKEGPVVYIGTVPIRVEVADTDALRMKGLSGRSSLGATNGMLFVFNKSGYHQIWMKDMRLVIDVIWIDEHFKVIDITRGLRPDTYPKIFEPRLPARFVIETNEHYAESFGIVVGDMVIFPPEVIPTDLREPGGVQ